MTCRVERYADAIYRYRVSIAKRLDERTIAEPRVQDGERFFSREIALGAKARVIRMRMRNQRSGDRLPRVDIKIAGLAKEAVIIKCEETRHVLCDRRDTTPFRRGNGLMNKVSDGRAL